MELQRHDVVVIGGGAAGRSAALVLGRARRTVALVDTGQPSNSVSSGIGGFLGHDQRSPQDFYETTRNELSQYPTINWAHGTVGGLRHGEDGWTASLDDGTAIGGTHVLLAMGMRYDLPPIPGIDRLWGASVFHCPFCHGWEHRDQPLLLLAEGPEPVKRALLLRNWSADVTVINPPGALSEPDRDRIESAGLRVIDGEIIGLHGHDRQLEGAELADGTVVRAQGMLVAAPHRQRSSLAASIGVETDESEHVVVDQTGRTNVENVWAAGDLTTPFAQVLIAAATGATAAAHMVHALVGT